LAVFDDIPLIDDHAHPMLPPEAAAREPFARYFSEGHDSDTVARHAPNALFYRQALRQLAGLLGCEASEQAVVATRAAQPFEGYLRRLLTEAGVEAVLLDDGYPRTGALSPAETAAILGSLRDSDSLRGREGEVRVRRVQRLERLIEDLLPAHESLASLETAMIGELGAARPELAALKSVIAYRSGLAITRPDRAEVERAQAEARVGATHASPSGQGEARVVPTNRLTSKPLLDHLVPLAAEWAAGQGLPLQLHTGFGDRDVDLRLANPLHLRPLLEGGALSRGPVVLLHASYPYVREAAYLASVYPNVYVDFSQAAPLLAGPALTRVLEELLALAPVTKILYGSDAWGIPEWFWLAARAARRALANALAWLPAAEASWAARRILHDNAAELYGLGA
jgi:hypothetical protein